MEIKGIFDKLRTNARNGWERLTERVKVIKVEASLNSQIASEFVEAAKETAEPVVAMAKSIWEASGSNFGERLRNTARFAWGQLTEGFDTLREEAVEGMDRLQTRYRREGVVGATLGIVSEAIETVRELPAQAGAILNNVRAGIEDIKIEMIDERQLDLTNNLTTGWREQYMRLDRVRDRAVVLGGLFEQRRLRCVERLTAMREGRERFANARSNVVIMTPAT